MFLIIAQEVRVGFKIRNKLTVGTRRKAYRERLSNARAVTYAPYMCAVRQTYGLLVWGNTYQTTLKPIVTL